MATTSFSIDRYDRSPLEFTGALLVESDGHISTGRQQQLSTAGSVSSSDPRYRIRVYEETEKAFVLELAVVAAGDVLFQTADFAASVDEIDELLCLLHQDAMDGLFNMTGPNLMVSWSVDTKPSGVELAEKSLLGQRLEANLDRQAVFVLQQLTENVAS